MFADPTFWSLIALIIFLGVVVYAGAPRMIVGALDKRANAIRSELDEAKRLREEAQALLAEYQRKAREAEKEASDILSQAARDAEALSAEAAERIKDYVARRTKMAEQKIAQAEAQAVAEVKARSADIAIAAAERVLAARVKGDQAAALIEKSISDVRKRLN
jgi:F-type H+-transporting ATPase subunit b